MQKIALFTVLMLFGLITWVVYLANTGQNSVFFIFVRALPKGDWLGHFLLFGVLALAANVALSFRRFNILGYEMLLGSSAVFLLCILEELSQILIPSRTADIADVFFDVLGIWVFSCHKLKQYFLGFKL